MPEDASSRKPLSPKQIQDKIDKLKVKKNLPEGSTHDDKHPKPEKRGKVITAADRVNLQTAIDGLEKKLVKLRAASHAGTSHAGTSHAGTSYGGHSAAPSEFGASASQAGHGTAGKASHKIVATNKTWAMIPPPMLDETACGFLGSKIPLYKTLMAYESHQMDRATRTFYVKSGDHSYIAYLPFQDGLSMEHSELKRESETLTSSNPGYIYHSDVYEYQEGDVKKHGYITLLIPFEYQELPDQDGEYVCAVHTIDYAQDDINSSDELFQHYKDHIFASSIPSGSTITGLERLKKTLHDLTNSKIQRQLYRTDNKLSEHIVRSHLVLKDQKKMHIQIAIAYTSTDIAPRASKLIKSIIFTMRKMVNAKVWRRAATESIFHEKPLNVSTWDNTHLAQIYTGLWTCTTWLLAKELCLGTMNMGRTVEMTKIFSTFVNTYVDCKAHPDRETLKSWYDYRQQALSIPHMSNSARLLDVSSRLSGPAKAATLLDSTRNW